MKNAFSLVELSIVLVILGLLTGGILSGQSLIRASELSAAVSEYQRYSSATQSFRDKYFAIAGDMTNASAFWGDEGGAASNCAAPYTGTTPRAGTCNGNGDGQLSTPTAVSSNGEMFQFWKQLALAGLIEGSYTGYSGPNSSPLNTGAEDIIGVNVPKSKLSNAGWTVFYIGNFPGNGATYAGSYGNPFILGAPTVGGGTGGPALKPEEAWNIDTKLDDGKPATGNINPFYYTGGCTNSTGDSDTASTYTLNNPAVLCALVFKQNQ